jgi:ATP-dependent DNA helicase RecG
LRSKPNRTLISQGQFIHAKIDQFVTHSDSLSTWFAKLTTLDGVGEKLAIRLSELIGGDQIKDLLFYKPTRWVNRSPIASISDSVFGEIQTTKGVVQQFSAAPRGSKVQRVRLVDDTGFLTLVFFNSNAGYLQKQFPVGKEIAVSGEIEDFHGQRQMTHPEYILSAEKIDEIPPVEPVYPLTAGITNKRLHSLILQALDTVESPQRDWIDPVMLRRNQWSGFMESLQSVHRPDRLDEDRIMSAIERLAYDEAFARALTFRLQRENINREGALSLSQKNGFKNDFVGHLPYKPTSAQTRAMDEISNDLQKTSPMQRMLQGDVGSGKTTVAAFACALAVQSMAQVAVMAPTEVLARQLYKSISEIVEPMGISSTCLSGAVKGKARQSTLESIANGSIDIVCGTHALFQDKVEFSKLALVIIDEQHRFGVNDRARLAQKGIAPHLLIMSATPIPRSLAMTVHGDVDLSILDEKPAGRQPIETRALPDSRLDEIISAVDRAISRGEQVFWVCPRVEDEEDGSAAISRHAMLDEIYEKPVGLVHGRLPSQAKEDALERFRNGETSVLVATTVIEVGVDVPGATIMVIEGAERFGLAQLHQLRGRVGRGNKKSHCLLVYSPPLGATARQRLDTLRKSEDGFYIAEVDFKLRGPGDILGLAQSGIPNFRFLDLSRHQGLLATSQKDAAMRLRAGETVSDSLLTLLQLLGPEQAAAPKI